MERTAELVEQCRRMSVQGKSVEELVSFLRTQGCSIVESIGILSSALGMGLGKAKEIVHKSKAWSDVRKQHDDFHASLDEYLIK